MQPAVSVIVVLYNAENTLTRCLDSIVNQSLTNFELIIVDDGSTDGSQDIIKRYINDDPRIKSVHQSNAGVSIARQKGLELVTGSYSIFVDADDWIEPDMLEILLDKAQQESSDMVFCDYLEDNGLGTFYRKQEPKSTDSGVVLNQMLVDLHGSLWNKLIRVSLYKDSDLRFVKGLNFCEDECFVIRLLSQGCSISYVDKALYHYDKISNTSSISNNRTCRPAEEYQLFIDSCSPYLQTPQLQHNLNERIAAIIKRMTYSTKEQYPACRKFYKKYKKQLFNSRMPFIKKVLCVLYFNGFRFIAGIRNFYQNSMD